MGGTAECMSVEARAASQNPGSSIAGQNVDDGPPKPSVVRCRTRQNPPQPFGPGSPRNTNRMAKQRGSPDSILHRPAFSFRGSLQRGAWERRNTIILNNSSFPSFRVGFWPCSSHRGAQGAIIPSSVPSSIPSQFFNSIKDNRRTRPNIHRTNAGIGSSVVMPAPRCSGHLARFGKAAGTAPSIGPIAPASLNNRTFFQMPLLDSMGDRDGSLCTQYEGRNSCPCSVGFHFPGAFPIRSTSGPAMALLFALWPCHRSQGDWAGTATGGPTWGAAGSPLPMTSLGSFLFPCSGSLVVWRYGSTTSMADFVCVRKCCSRRAGPHGKRRSIAIPIGIPIAQPIGCTIICPWGARWDF